jgi:tetratricopeptide (TPR) repeat protein
VHESPRIAELRRRVHADPASIAFAQLAEEYRRAGNHEDAVRYCRTGLARHPGYLSARVTLGRALVELGDLNEAASEFELVLASAPDNLAAIRGIAEIERRRGNLAAALTYYQRALALARFDPELEETVNQINREMGTVAPPATPSTTPLSAAAEGLIDFDALLESLGVPDAAPPPVVEMLLSRTPAAVTPLASAAPDVPANASAVDAFAELERELLAFEQPRAATALDAGDLAMLEELEAWARVLQSERALLTA